MVTHDTIELLKECDSGVKMGLRTIEELKDRVDDENLKTILSNSRQIHAEIETEIGGLLREYGLEEQEPPMMATSMSWLKTNMKMSMNASDSTASDLITDGCNMGIKSLQKYLNTYERADEKAKSIAKKIIATEEKLQEDMRQYL